MDNDKAFGIFAAFIVAGTATVITASVLGMGGSFPPLAYLAEHFALSFLFRSAYKSFDGTNWLAQVMDAIGLVGIPEVPSASPIPMATADAA